MLYLGQEHTPGYPTQVALCCRFSPHGIGLSQLLKTGGAIPDPFQYLITEGVRDAVTEHGGIDKDLADMVELVGRLGQYLHQELAAFFSVRSVDLSFFSRIGQAIRQAVES